MEHLTIEAVKEKEFLVYLIRSGIRWIVSDDEAMACNSYDEFLGVHVRNTGSSLKLTKRVRQYPGAVIYALTCITDDFVLHRLLNFFATDGAYWFNGFTPDLHRPDPHHILATLYLRFYEHHLGKDVSGSRILLDYCYMAADGDNHPNLRIKSIRRLKQEHDRLAKRYREEDVEEFEIDDPAMLPTEKEGYQFLCITNKEMLLAEADEMQHCVDSYSLDIMKGESIIYSIRGKERATLELYPTEDGITVEQIRGINNKPVSDFLIQLIDDIVGSINLEKSKTQLKLEF